MKYEVIIATRAQHEAQAAHDWWSAHRSAEQAARWYDEFLMTAYSLEQNPEGHATAPENDRFPRPPAHHASSLAFAHSRSGYFNSWRRKQMSRNISWAVAAAIALVAGDWLFAQQPQDPSVEIAQVGRYTLINNHLIDTATGRTWLLRNSTSWMPTDRVDDFEKARDIIRNEKAAEKK